MPVNYLEQLAAEWYEFQGYYVKRNTLVGKRAKGGHECELDVVAFHPGTRHLVHIEASMDADSWATRERRFHKKFAAGKKHIPTLYQGMGGLPEPEQYALLVFASKQNRDTVGGAPILLLSELLQVILRGLADRKITSAMVSEHLVVLRSLQFVSQYRKEITAAWRARPRTGSRSTGPQGAPCGSKREQED